jgi:hypothetical protein
LPVGTCWQAGHEETVEQQGRCRDVGEQRHPVGRAVVLGACEVDGG